MHRLGFRIVTGFVAFALGLLAWMVFVFASPTATLNTQERVVGSRHAVSADVPTPPAKSHGCPSRHQ